MDNFSAKKDQVLDEILEIITSSLEKGEISVEDSQKAATFVLPKFDEVTSNDQLINFLDELSQVWPIFHFLYSKIKNEAIVTQDQVQIEQIQNNLSTITDNLQNQ